MNGKLLMVWNGKFTMHSQVNREGKDRRERRGREPGRKGRGRLLTQIPYIYDPQAALGPRPPNS